MAFVELFFCGWWPLMAFDKVTKTFTVQIVLLYIPTDIQIICNEVFFLYVYFYPLLEFIPVLVHHIHNIHFYFRICRTKIVIGMNSALNVVSARSL